MTPQERERVQLIHTYDTLPSSNKRKLRLLRELYLKPSQCYTELKKVLRTRRDDSTRPIIESLINDGYIMKCKRSLYVPQIQSYRVVPAYKITSKAENLLKDQVKQ